MGSAQIRWTSDRGFEVDVEVSDDDVALRLLSVPVPADGTLELEQGVDLDRLDILFKAVVKTYEDPAVRADAEASGSVVALSRSPQEFRSFVESETRKFEKLVKAANLSVNN